MGNNINIPSFELVKTDIINSEVIDPFIKGWAVWYAERLYLMKHTLDHPCALAENDVEMCFMCDRPLKKNSGLSVCSGCELWATQGS